MPPTPVDARLPELTDPKLFINREVSWLAFNERVLDEAREASLPLYERLKFLSIVVSNLDEFFMVRVAGLKQQALSGVTETRADGLTAQEQLTAISARVHPMVGEVDAIWQGLVPQLSAAGVHLLHPDEMTSEQRAAAEKHFREQVFPALTPLAVDPGHPFPHLRNKSINLAVLLRRREARRRKSERLGRTVLAVVQVPGVLSRLVRLPSADGQVHAFALLGELISAYSAELFPGFTVKHVAAFRVTRNWDLNLDEDESEDLLESIEAELRRRDRGAAVRLEIHQAVEPELVATLAEALKLGADDIYHQAAPLQLSDLISLSDHDLRPELRVEALAPHIPPQIRDAESLFPLIGAGDILLHHPYEAFDPVAKLIEEAADDPNVLAIKMTLYRTSGDSPFVRALMRASENGKQVAVLVELKARFDEANNIAWALRLEENGVHVVYGLLGLKTHCKVLLIVRREAGRIRRYVHLGTGNYNATTARQYTDLSLFTTRPELADDVTALFNMLTGFSDAPTWKRLAVAPLGLQERIVQLIDREAQRAKKGERARIVAKMNSLVDPVAIRALYAASQAGVEVDLLVRGICCLRPGVKGVSDRIRVRSIVDRFLEHSRVFAFGVGDKTDVFLSSADWMPRNFLRRIEVMFPVEDPALRARVLDDLAVQLKDNMRARELMSDGSYRRVPSSGAPLRSQVLLMERARRPQPARLADPMLRHVPAPDPDPRRS